MISLQQPTIEYMQQAELRNPAKQKVIYFLSDIENFRSVVSEVFWFKNIFDSSRYDHVIITHPPTGRVNMVCYDFVMRSVRLFQIHGYRLVEQGRGLINIDCNIHLMEESSWLENSFPVMIRDNKPSFYYSLGPEDIEHSRQIFAAFGIPYGAPVVVLYNRQPRWQSGLDYHSHRNADIRNYYPAIEYLVSSGYYVVRFGDKSMKPLSITSDRVIDAPFHPAYTQHVELYFTALCRFFISVPSGPLSFAVAFNKPTIWINSPVQSVIWGNQNDLLVPKKYYSHKLQRHLSYSEIITSPLIDCYRTDGFTEQGVELQQNTPQEILRSVQEMELRLEGKYHRQFNLDEMKKRIKDIQLQGHLYRQKADPKFPYYATFLSPMQVGNEFIRMNPYFIEQRGITLNV